MGGFLNSRRREALSTCRFLSVKTKLFVCRDFKGRTLLNEESFLHSLGVCLLKEQRSDVDQNNECKTCHSCTVCCDWCSCVTVKQHSPSHHLLKADFYFKRQRVVIIAELSYS